MTAFHLYEFKRLFDEGEFQTIVDAVTEVHGELPPCTTTFVIGNNVLPITWEDAYDLAVKQYQQAIDDYPHHQIALVKCAALLKFALEKQHNELQGEAKT